MATTTIQDIIAELPNYQYNPASIQARSVQLIEDSYDGTMKFVDPTNPVIQALQVSALHCAAALQKMETNTRLQYPRSALTYEDLYPHMSDKDFVGRFADGAWATFTLLFIEDEVKLNMVTDPATGIRKIIIPRNTYFTVGGNIYSIQYPIEIRQLVHGGLNIVYDTSIESPLEELTTNELTWYYTTGSDGTPLIAMDVKAQQFSIFTQTNAVSDVREFTFNTTLDDSFMYARIYYQEDDGSWTEMVTTHTALTFDVATPTALLKVLDKNVTVTIPYVYISSGLVKNQIRMDIYQTKGAIVQLLNLYQGTDFSANWFVTDKTRDWTVYSTPLEVISVSIFSNSTVNGGRDQISFETLRNQVIANSVGGINRPITPDQITYALEDDGYQLVKNIDLVTNRVFLATKSMPTPTNSKLITAAAASIQTLNVSMEVAALHPKVKDNGSSITFTPDMIYRLNNGILSIVPQAEIDALLAMSVDQRALQIAQTSYLFTPFYYVLDASDPASFDLRPYYLSNPEAETKRFVGENQTTMMQVQTSAYTVSTTDSGFKLRVVTKSDDTWKNLPEDEVYVQLAFTPPNETNRAYTMGTLVGRSDDNERIYEFDLSSNMNVDSNDYIQLTKFMMYNTDPKVIGTELYTPFDILYSTTAQMESTYTRDDIDDILGTFMLPADVKGITHEIIRIRFGYALHTLWSRARTMSSTITYKKYESDVIATYTKDVYAPFDDGEMIHIVDGVAQTNLVHHEGDPILDSDGNPTYIHRAGDLVKDPATGNPIQVDGRQIYRQIDLMQIDGVYKFATDTISTGYLQELIDTVVGWITGDLADLQARALEQTKIYFYPKVTMGDIDVIIDSGLTTSVPANQSFNLTLYVHRAVYTDDTLKDTLTKMTISTLSSGLDSDILATSNFISALKAVYSDDVIGFQMDGFGSAGKIEAMTIIDDSKRLSIKKRLVPQADNTLIVQEDVTITYKRQEIDN